jgi:O-antigen/teichoic acid export membrane protein
MTILSDAEAVVDPIERPATPLKHRVFRAGSWTLAGHFLSLSLRFVSSLILTRIFSPDTFGTLAIITAVTTVIGLLTDIGLRQAIVQSRNGSSPKFLHTAWSVQAIRGLLVWGLCVTVAGCLHVASISQFLPLDSVYAQPRLPGLIIVSSLSAVILGFQSMKTYMATRDLNLGRVTLIDIFSQFAGLIIIVTLGWLTRSIWSYIGGLLLATTITVLLGHICLRGPRDRLGWDRESLRELSHFGRWIFLSSAISATILNGDRMFLAAWLSPAGLGFYSIANNLASVPDALANSLFGSVAMPTLSEVNRSQPERFSGLFSRIRWLSDSLLLFVAGFLFAAGASIIGFLYDPRYAAAGWMLQWLSFSLVFARYNIAGSAYLALGRPYYVTVVNVVRSISLFVFLAVGFHMFGVSGAIIGIAFHMVPSTLCMLYFNNRLGIGNFRLESMILLIWAVGWVVGKGFDALIIVIKPHVVG